MALSGGGARVHDIAAALTAAGLACEVSSDVWAAIWKKLAFTAAMNALAAVTRLTVRMREPGA